MASPDTGTIARSGELSGDTRIVTADGTALYAEWKRPGQPLGAIVLVHGLGEHCGRYHEFRDELVSGGLACYGYDQRGHGRSGGRRGHVRRFEEYVDDLERVVTEARTADGAVPFFLFGHSMGSLVVLQFAIRAQSGLRGLVLSGCPLKPGVLGFPPLVTLVALIARVAPRLSFDNRIRPEQLTHDVELREEFARDPLKSDRVTARWIVEFARAVRFIRDEAGAIEVPLLALHGAEDPIADPRGTDELLKLVGSQDKRAVVSPGERHEVLNETADRRAHSQALITDWIDRHLQ